MSDSPAPIRHPLLDDIRVPHGFGVRGSAARPDVLRPEQVHGAQVARVVAHNRLDPEVADAVVSSRDEVPIAVVTADCVPILAASLDGRSVLAIHAGWRGLVADVIARGIEGLRREAGGDAILVAVIGPHIGVCCYEVDAPVLDAARERFGDALVTFIRPSRVGHAHIDLGGLAALALEEAGVEPDRRATVAECCTHCDPVRFHSYRRDGQSAGRLLHHIQPARG